MYYKISANIALRSWDGVPRAYYLSRYPYAQPLTEEEFETMLVCDGEHDLDLDETVMSLVFRHMITACDKGDRPSEWSRLKRCRNRYFPKMNLMITGRCNYNCLHCFNAADNAPLMTEWAFEELCSLLDQALDCGIHAITITGGEPMVHNRFMDIIGEIHKRGMFVEELNTNGSRITQDALDRMRKIGCDPLVKISFDGIGCHDWIRGKAGAEQEALDAMRLCVSNGFHVLAQTQAHRRNAGALMPTAEALCAMGIDEMRIIRTTEVPRWVENAKDACLGMEEYYEKMLAFAQEYASSGMQMEIDVWQFLRLHPSERCFQIVPVACAEGEYKDTLPGCRGARGMVAVTSSGDIVPCIQMSGQMAKMGVRLGNLHQDRLSDLLSSSAYLCNVCATVGDVRRNNPKCASCTWFEACTGGCRGMGFVYSGERRDFLGEDLTKCAFFQNGWYKRVTDALSGWRNLSEIALR